MSPSRIVALYDGGAMPASFAFCLLWKHYADRLSLPPVTTPEFSEALRQWFDAGSPGRRPRDGEKIGAWVVSSPWFIPPDGTPDGGVQ